jgi:hypothetical protein
MMTESSSCFWNVTETQDADVCDCLLEMFGGFIILIYTHHWELMNSVGSHGS